MFARVASQARRLTLWPRCAVVFFGLLMLVGASALAAAYAGPAGSAPAPPAAPASTLPPGPTGADLAAMVPTIASSTPPAARTAAPTAARLAGNTGPQPAGTATPTAADKAAPTLGAFDITPLVGATVVTPNPTAVPALALDSSVVNVLLVGTDYRSIDNTFRTDTLIIASINTDEGSVNLL